MPRVHHLGRIAGSLLAALLTTLLATQIALADAPGSSGIVSRLIDHGGFSYYDAGDNLTALGGPPAEEGCVGEGFDDPAMVMLVELPNGVLKVNVRQGPTDVFVYEGTLDEICQTVIEGGTVEPLYVGWMSTVLNDNDGGASLTRGNSFGLSSHGMVWDVTDGNRCALSAHARLQITRDAEFLVRTEGINISC